MAIRRPSRKTSAPYRTALKMSLNARGPSSLGIVRSFQYQASPVVFGWNSSQVAGTGKAIASDSISLLIASPGAWGAARIDEGSKSGNHFGAGAGETSPGGAPHHLRQRAAVHRLRLQGVHSGLRHDPCPDLAVLSAIERGVRIIHQNVEVRGGLPDGISRSRRHSSQYRHVSREGLQPKTPASALGYLPPAEFGRSLLVQTKREAAARQLAL